MAIAHHEITGARFTHVETSSAPHDAAASFYQARATYAEVLRAIGDFLDAQFADRASIVVEEEAVTIQWYAPCGVIERRHYLHDDLAVLAQQARWLRGSPFIEQTLRRKDAAGRAWGGHGVRGELLRTLGQNLDRDEIAVEWIEETPDGFRVFGAFDGRDLDSDHSFAQLNELGATRRQLRNAAFAA